MQRVMKNDKMNRNGKWTSLRQMRMTIAGRKREWGERGDNERFAAACAPPDADDDDHKSGDGGGGGGASNRTEGRHSDNGRGSAPPPPHCQLNNGKRRGKIKTVVAAIW